MAYGEEHGQIINDYAAGTNSGATATAAAATGKTHYITGITAYSDTDTLITIKDGTTTVWEYSLDIDVVGEAIDINFKTPIELTEDNKCDAEVASSTSDCAIQLRGYTL